MTLEADNLAWVRGRALAAGRISVSEMLDRLIAGARRGGRGGEIGVRPVVGTVEIAAGDPLLETADETIRGLLAASVARTGRAMAGARGERAARRKASGTGLGTGRAKARG